MGRDAPSSTPRSNPPSRGHLAAGALDDARHRGFTVVPLCPFVTAYLRHHPEQLDVVEEPYRTRLGGG